ncbi:MAG: hypothetical protein K5829_10215 [Treponema sp.]|nr:hypothetical protein [Treponema sp.]
MRVYLYSPQKGIAEIIADHLRQEDHDCLVIDYLEEVFLKISNEIKKPDLLILDYLSFNHDTFNIIKNLNNYNVYLPVIFYNDPCLVRSNRVRHWRAQVQLLQCKDERKDLDFFDKIFESIQNFVESEEMRPFISLMQRPKELPDKLIKHQITMDTIKDNLNDGIFLFKKRNKLPNSLYYLLSIFQKNKDTFINLEDILKEYDKEEKRMTRDSLKVLISRLRNTIRKDKECNFLIVKEKNSYKFIVYK